MALFSIVGPRSQFDEWIPSAFAAMIIPFLGANVKRR
jgi:hypothetical protein